ncbi:MAG: TolC family protein [Candidatus Omnitrophica bacterium]|nr:TolC family protein [Candidatus Omnitrophota bacterium]
MMIKRLTFFLVMVGVIFCFQESVFPEQPRIFEAPLFTEKIPPAPEVFSKDEVAMKPGELFTLPRCYALSLRESELIAINADRVKETEARFLQALSIMMPHISFISNDLQESIPDDSGTFSTQKPSKSSDRRFNYNQTLFSGFKAFAGMKGANLERKQRINEMIRAEQLLLLDVSDAFYTLMETREDLNALDDTKKSLMKRIVELRARERLGRSRQSEVVNAKAQLYGVESTIELVKSNEDVARQILEFLIGGPIGETKDHYPVPSELMVEEYYLSRSALRPDVEAAKYAWQTAVQASKIVDSDFLPTVSVDGNYYTQRTGFDEGTDWDITLSVNVPIFEGTETLGRSKEYALKAHESKLLFERAKRVAPYDIKDAYVKLKAAIAVYECLKKAFDTAKLNYHLQRKDYERSLVSNLDVLAAIQTLEESHRNYIRALYAAKRLYWRLRVAAAEDITESF